ncbi:hypothetical protein [Sinorhizobium saheli]|uniref:Uncharacterized protein n=1 Tax=Sinorhizobium saheli TaxID=36856 RepID=A0A178XYH0_SINSA|nr:hypothetical protein [Sinorhizobium saheli]MQW90164.1 hypothetical protein [Sinorhizobium saheli]OAP40287.1 hypothetical protein ATB98_02305 [Sinorhizobium saheli]
MKTLATTFFLLSAALAHAGPPAKVPSSDPDDMTARRFLTGSDFETGMTFAEVQAVISRRYADWQKTENRLPVKTKQDGAPATFVATVELKSPRAPGDSPLSDVYRLSFTSPLSGSVLYGITRDVKFSHLPKDRIATGQWVRTLSAYWGEPYAVVGPDEDKLVSAAFFFNDAGVATARGDGFCTKMFAKLDAISRNAADNTREVIGEIEKEGCHFLVEARAIVGEHDLLVRTLSRRTDVHAYVKDMDARQSRGSR